MLGWWGFHAYYEGQVQTAGRAIPKIIWRTDILTKKILPPFKSLQAWQKQLLRRMEVQNVMKSIIEDDMERKFVYFIIKGIASLTSAFWNPCKLCSWQLYLFCDVISDVGMAIDRQLQFGWQWHWLLIFEGVNRNIFERGRWRRRTRRGRRREKQATR